MGRVGNVRRWYLGRFEAWRWPVGVMACSLWPPHLASTCSRTLEWAVVSHRPCRAFRERVELSGNLEHGATRRARSHEHRAPLFERALALIACASGSTRFKSE